MIPSSADLSDEFVALDTNEYVLALPRDPRFPNCFALLLEHIHKLWVHIPLQVLKELHKILSTRELHRVFGALEVAQVCRVDYTPGDLERVSYWEQQGAKLGDAVIVAQLEAAGVGFLVSENRHFLLEVDGLPFEVLTSEQIVHLPN